LVPELAAWVRARPKAFLDLPESALSKMYTPAPLLKDPGPKAEALEMAEWLHTRGVTISCAEVRYETGTPRLLFPGKGLPDGPITILSAGFSYDHCTNSETLAALTRWIGRGSIEEINLEDCRLQSADVAAMASFPRLRDLDLGRARFPRGALRSLLGAASLERLSLTGTTVSDEELRPLGLLPNLQSLEVRATKITGSTLSLFGPLSSLELGFSPLADCSLPYLDRTPDLKSLLIGGVPLTTQAIERIARLPQLATLTLWDTGLKESDLEPLRAHGTLRSLTFQGLAFSAAAADFFAGLPGLRDLHIGDIEKPQEMLARLRTLRPDLELPKD
jgi:hypothetical protein